MILPSYYLAPISYYVRLAQCPSAVVDFDEIYRKQTLHNRCWIASPNGPMSLTVPVVKFVPYRTPMRDIRISDHGNWRHLHWNALRSNYGRTPFFEFYADDFAPFYERRWTFLTDFNDEICALMCQLLDITPHLQPTTCFLTAEECANRHIHDFRDAIRPKHPLPDPGFQPQRYYQVFEGENGFLPNLSILDLLMNCGNESIFFL